jgi:hypothetical protein
MSIQWKFFVFTFISAGLLFSLVPHSHASTSLHPSIHLLPPPRTTLSVVKTTDACRGGGTERRDAVASSSERHWFESRQEINYPRFLWVSPSFGKNSGTELKQNDWLLRYLMTLFQRISSHFVEWDGKIITNGELVRIRKKVIPRRDWEKTRTPQSGWLVIRSKLDWVLRKYKYRHYHYTNLLRLYAFFARSAWGELVMGQSRQSVRARVSTPEPLNGLGWNLAWVLWRWSYL